MGSGFNWDRVKLFTGNNFVCASNNKGKLFRFVWNGNTWIRSDVTETTGERWTTATNNYILSHDPSPSPDVIRLYYLDQLMNWQTRTQSVTGFNSTGVDQQSGPNQVMNWYSSNSSAFVLANESHEMIIQWDENYNNIVRVDPGWYYADYSKIYFDGTTLGLVTPMDEDDQSKNRGLRRSGYSWIDSGEKVNTFGYEVESGTWHFGMAAFGPDLMVWNSDVPAPTWDFKYQAFDPATSLWLNEVQLSNTENPHVNVGPDFFTVGRKMYMKTAAGYALAANQLLSLNDDVFPSSTRFLATASRILWLRNGDVEGYDITAGRYRVRNNTTVPYQYMVGSSIYVYSSSGFEDHFLDETSLVLRRATSIAGTYDHRVIKVQIDDGNAQQYISFGYANPVYGPNETSVMYNKVTMVTGSESVLSRPNGYTDTYFYNSLGPSEVSSPIPKWKWH